MFKKIVLSLIAIMGIAFSAYAQKQVSGTVVDVDGVALPGVTVIVSGTTTGTVTDDNGKYSIAVPAGKSLQFSVIGMKTQLIPVDGKAVINVQLELDSLALDEVVVTALGITKSEKALGYSATTVKSEELTASRTSNALQSIAGKVAGVQISQSSQTAGSQQSVIIRGISSIGGSNQPLYVIDGVPMQTLSVSNTTAGNGNLGSGIGSLSNDDIESLTVLKGAAATALYGSRASGGVIIINTKGGAKNTKTLVTVNAGMQVSTISRLPEFQNTFGTGWDGSWTQDENGSWGPILNDKVRIYGPVVNNSQMIKDYKAIPNNIRNFFENGLQYNTSVSLQGGNDKTSYYASYSNVSDDGMLPTNVDRYTKNTLSFRGSHQAYKWLSLSSSVNLSTQATTQVGESTNVNSLVEGLYQAGRDISFIDAKDLSNPFNTPEGWYTPYGVMNPYWVIANAYNKADLKKVFGKLQADITPTQHLRLTYRYGFDYTDYDRKVTEVQISLPSSNPNASSDNQDGYVGINYGRYFEKNHDFLANYTNKFLGDKLDVNLVAGVNINDRYSTAVGGSVTGLTFDTGFWDVSNSPNNPSLSESQSERRSYSVFADFQFGWNDELFLDVTARNDWSSTLPKDNNSFFYPGATLSWIFSKYLKNSPLSFGKLRLAYGMTGNDPSAYQTTATYAQGGSTAIYGAATSPSFPFAGYNGYMKSATLASATLQPEMTTEFEVGADLRFFEDRLGLDVAYYNRVSDMQIFSLPVDPATGYSTMVMNFGKVRNKGIELLLTTTPVKTRNFKWDVDFNFSKNWNMVESLPEGLEGGKAQLNRDGWGDVYIYAEVGKPIGQIYATLPQYTDDGKIICNASGCPIQSSDKLPTGYTLQNDWVGGLSSTLTYKNVSLSATLDIHHGGKMYSRTKSLLWFTGNSIETTYNQRRTFIVPNSVQAVTGSDGTVSYVENDVPISQYESTFQYYYDGNTSYPLEGSACVLVDRSYMKLRNISLTYDLPKKWIEPIGLKGLAISAVGNNVYFWTPASNCYIDPDQGYTTDLDGMLGEYYCTVPTRYFGFNVKVTF